MTLALNNAVGKDRGPSMPAVVLAGSVGTVMEWYDFLVYATMAALVFNKLFFPGASPLAGTLASLATYAVGFVARPLGGALFGHYGDRLGRKSTLAATLAITGIATFVIGLLPTYSSIGVLAPVLLVTLRFAQGIGLGGEWGGAALMVIEHAPADRRGLYGSLVQVGFPIGIVLSTSAVSLAAMLPEATLLAWGWRLPFLGSIVLFAFGTIVRWKVAESPVFLDMKTRMALSANPLAETARSARGGFLKAVGLKITEVSWVYMLTVFVVVYATTRLKLPKAMILDIILVAALCEVATIPFFGWLSDRIGRRPLFLAGALFTVAFAFPLFTMLDTKDPTVIALAIVVGMNLGHGMMFALEAAYFPELFEDKVRCTGASLGFQVAAAIGGGLMPLVATWLVGVTGGTSGVSLMLGGLAAVTFVAALCARETRTGGAGGIRE